VAQVDGPVGVDRVEVGDRPDPLAAVAEQCDGRDVLVGAGTALGFQFGRVWGHEEAARAAIKRGYGSKLADAIRSLDG